MHLSGMVGHFVLAIGALVGGLPPGQPTAGFPEPIYTRQALFAIPFRMTQAYQRGRDPVYVLLYVSVDRGGSWQWHSQVEPERGHFLFQAAADGEYWFLIRTVIRGMPMPRPVGDQPELRVVVDTTPPQLELRGERGPAGQIVVHWQVTDPNVIPESLKIQYRTAPDQTWQTVAIEPARPGRPEGQLRGQASWWQAEGAERIEIRAEVADRAGNTSVNHAHVAMRPGTSGLGAGNSGAVATPQGPPQPSPDLPAPQLNAPGSSAGGRPPTSQWRPMRHTPSRSHLEGRGQAQHTHPIEPDHGMASSGRGAPEANPADPRPRPSVPPSPPGTAPQSASARSVKVSEVGTRSIPAVGEPPPERWRFVPTQTFALQYDLGSAPLAPGDQVEIWGTRDGGRTWSPLALDPDNQSPALITVNEDGVYGFRIGIRSGGGSAHEEFARSGAPDLWVVVRSGPPSAPGGSAGSARILDAHPVASNLAELPAK